MAAPSRKSGSSSSRSQGGRGRGAAPAGKRSGAGARGAAGRSAGAPSSDAGKGGDRRSQVDERVQQLAGPLNRVLQRLPATQRNVLEHRMGLVDGHPKNLAETARALGLTMHEAKEIEQRAFEHIREAIPLNQLSKLLKD